MKNDFRSNRKPKHTGFPRRKTPKSERPIHGIHPVLEAIRAGREIEKILLLKSSGTKLLSEFSKEIKEFNIPFQFVPQEKLNHLVKSTSHQGVVALVSPVSYRDLENILPGIYEKGEIPLILILDRITDVRNLGAMARSAECAGAHAIVVPSRGSGQINHDTIKSSAGAIFNIPICRSENLKKTIETLKNNGLQIIACTEKADKPVYHCNFTLPTALILGSEEDGISPEYLRMCDEQVLIPMKGKTESLNVSVSAGICLFEVLRQRQFVKK